MAELHRDTKWLPKFGALVEAWHGVVVLRFLSVCGCAALVACSSASDPVTIAVSGGLDRSVFPDAVSTVALRVRSVDGSEKVLQSVAASTGGVDFPSSAETGSGALVIAGLDGAGNELAYGRTPYVDLTSIGYSEEQITILVDRPGALTDAITTTAPTTPIATMAGARYLVLGDTASLDAGVVDLLGWSSYADSASFDSAPVTIAPADENLLVLDAAGNSAVLTIGSDQRATANPPQGLAFTDVLGGLVVPETLEASWIVGAARLSSASDVVMRFDSTGDIAGRKLSRARMGAAAAYVSGRGLVVLGGTTPSGVKTPGIELVSTSTPTTGALPFPDDDATGIAVATDANTVVRVRDDGVVESFDLSCAQACAAKAATVTLPPITPRADDVAITLERGGLVVARAGKISRIDATLATSVDLFDAKAEPVAMAALSNGAVAIVVGGDTTVRTLR